MNRRLWHGIALATLTFALGCATMKESDTARTGVEQILISSAVDRTLEKVDFRPIAHANVYLEDKYLDCVDKNYILVALHQKLLNVDCKLVAKAEEADVVVEVGSGGVGTDRNELFLGVPEIPLPPPSPIAIPRLPLFTRTKAMGTAKLAVVAYDVKTKQAVINTGYALARADHKSWTVLGMSGVTSGTVPTELAAATGEADSLSVVPAAMTAQKPTTQK